MSHPSSLPLSCCSCWQCQNEDCLITNNWHGRPVVEWIWNSGNCCPNWNGQCRLALELHCWLDSKPQFCSNLP